MITLLDYGAGNVRSVTNAIERLGETVKVASGAEDILTAEKLVFPGVGAFGNMMDILNAKQFIAPLKAYLTSERPFFGICLGMHALFDFSEESGGTDGLGIFKGTVRRFTIDIAVAHIVWNGALPPQATSGFHRLNGVAKFYFLASYLNEPEVPDLIPPTMGHG